MYDDPMDPSVFGSGGGYAGTLPGGAGGGLIQIIVSQNLFLFENSALSANGVAGANGVANDEWGVTQHSGAGGGSGGSINVLVDGTFYLSQFINVNVTGGEGGIEYGGSGGMPGGGGAGGRIYVQANYTQVDGDSWVLTIFHHKGGSSECYVPVAQGTLNIQCSPGL
jgi:hypothetical protein